MAAKIQYFFKIFPLVLLTACGVPAILQGDKVVYTSISPHPIEKTADCIFKKLDPIYGHRLSKTDLPSENTIYIEAKADGALRLWRISLTKAAVSKTQVEVIGLGTMAPGASFDPTGAQETQFYAPIRACTA